MAHVSIFLDAGWKVLRAETSLAFRHRAIRDSQVLFAVDLGAARGAVNCTEPMGAESKTTPSGK